MTTNNSLNFLTLNSQSVERLQDDDDCYGYDYNRLVDALDGLRTGVVNLVNPTITAVSQTLLTTVRTYEFSVDPTFPALLKFVLPTDFKPAVAKISWTAGNFRYIPSGSGGGTTSTDSTATTPSTDATGESGHSHSHNHVFSVTGGTAGSQGNVTGNGVTPTFIGTLQISVGSIVDSNAVGFDSSASSGHSHSHNHGSHSHSHNHTFSGITFSYTEGTSSTIDALLIDGVDKTSSIIPAGPWATDQILIDLLKIIPSGDNKWHTIQLTPHAQGRFSVEFTLGG